MPSWPRIAQVGGALRVERRRIVPELLAGVTLAALCLPLNLGYAEAAGLPASAGLYATMLPLAVYGLFAGSRHLVIGPDATVAAFMVATIGPLAKSSGVSSLELAAGMSALVALTLVVFWALRAGIVVRYLSRAVLVGFIAGLATEVLTSQIRKILNVKVESDDWLGEVAGIVRAIPHASLASVAVGVATIAGVRLLAVRAPRLPAALITLTAVTVVVAIWTPGGVTLLGGVPSGLPAVSVPTFGLSTWLRLAPAAIAISALTVAEGLLLAKNSARKHTESLDPNAELFAIGAANCAGAVTGAMPSGASASRTAALDAAGARSQLPSLVGAAVVAIVALAFTDAVAKLPTAALAGLVASAVVTTIDMHELRYFARVRRSELAIALACSGGVLVLGPLRGVVVAVLVSVVDVVRRSANAPWARIEMAAQPPDTGRYHRAGSDAPVDGLRAVRPGGALFFANAEQMQDFLVGVGTEPRVRWVLVDFERVSDVDPTAAEALIEAANEIRRGGRVLALSRVDAVVLVQLDKYGAFDVIARDRVYTSNREAELAFTDASLNCDTSREERGLGGQGNCVTRR